jgi:hypothetical protein
MAPPRDPNQPATPDQPNLVQLLRNYLDRQAGAHATGLPASDRTGEVLPYEAGPVQPIDAKLAWDEALAATRCFAPDTSDRSWGVPPAWSNLVAGHEPVVALAFCLGNFPQLVRDLHPLLGSANLAELRPTGARSVPVPGLREWVTQVKGTKQAPQLLLAAGILRLAKQFDEAAELLDAREAAVTPQWRGAWANEQAALAWQRGQGEKARALWDAQPSSVPVAFNRGMAALFFGDTAAARASLGRAVAGLPEDGSWYHLARLYLALAAARG